MSKKKRISEKSGYTFRKIISNIISNVNLSNSPHLNPGNMSSKSSPSTPKNPQNPNFDSKAWWIHGVPVTTINLLTPEHIDLVTPEPAVGAPTPMEVDRVVESIDHVPVFEVNTPKPKIVSHTPVMSPATPMEFSPSAKYTTDSKNGDEVATNWLGLRAVRSSVSSIFRGAHDSGILWDRAHFKDTNDGNVAFESANNAGDSDAGMGLYLPPNHIPLVKASHLIAFDGEMRAFSTTSLALDYKAGLEAQGDDNHYVLYATIEETPTDKDPNRMRRGASRKAVAVIGVFAEDKASMANDPTFGLVNGTPLYDYAFAKINAELNYEVIPNAPVTLPLDTGGDNTITLLNRPCWSLVASRPILPCVDGMPNEIFVHYGETY